MKRIITSGMSGHLVRLKIIVPVMATGIAPVMVPATATGTVRAMVQS